MPVLKKCLTGYNYYHQRFERISLGNTFHVTDSRMTMQAAGVSPLGVDTSLPVTSHETLGGLFKLSCLRFLIFSVKK